MNRVDLKIVLLGNATVGKTSLMERYVHDTFNDSRPYQNVSILFEYNYHYYVEKTIRQRVVDKEKSSFLESLKSFLTVGLFLLAELGPAFAC